MGYPDIEATASLAVYANTIDKEIMSNPDSVSRGIMASFAEHLEDDWDVYYKISFLQLLYMSAYNPYEVKLHIKANHPRLLWNGKEINELDIPKKLIKFKSKIPDSLHKHIIISLTADEEVKMKVLTDVKLALKEAEARRMNYSTVKKE